MTVNYKCCFKVESPFNISLNKKRWVWAKNLCDFSNGFWLNKDYEFTRGSDSKYWIPPNAIIYVEKTQ